jgi:hypothetical protein
VVITINYRLGPAGLFAHPALTAEAAKAAPLGNFCLLDMMAALRWTRENISAFGGDSGNITISGSSAGGTSCLFLMGIPEAKDLFHKAIIHSSGGIRNIQTLAQAEAAGLRLSERLGPDANAKPADLRRLSGNDLAISTAFFRQLDLPVKPIVDGRLVTQVPADTFASGKQARIPVLMGAANGESGARQLGDDIATSGAFGFQVENATHMARAGQPAVVMPASAAQPVRTTRCRSKNPPKDVASAKPCWTTGPPSCAPANRKRRTVLHGPPSPRPHLRPWSLATRASTAKALRLGEMQDSPMRTLIPEQSSVMRKFQGRETVESVSWRVCWAMVRFIRNQSSDQVFKLPQSSLISLT